MKLIPVWIFFILKPRSNYCFSVLWWTIYLSLSFTFRSLCLPHWKSPFLKSKWMIVMIARNFSPVNTVKVIGIPLQIRFSIISSLSGSLYNLSSRFFTCNAPSQANPGVEKYQTESTEPIILKTHVSEFMVITRRLHFKLFPDIMCMLVVFIRYITVVWLWIEPCFGWQFCFIKLNDTIHVIIWVRTFPRD